MGNYFSKHSFPLVLSFLSIMHESFGEHYMRVYLISRICLNNSCISSSVSSPNSAYVTNPATGVCISNWSLPLNHLRGCSLSSYQMFYLLFILINIKCFMCLFPRPCPVMPQSLQKVSSKVRPFLLLYTFLFSLTFLSLKPYLPSLLIP